MSPLSGTFGVSFFVVFMTYISYTRRTMACIEISWNICHHDNQNRCVHPTSGSVGASSSTRLELGNLRVNPTCQKENDRELVDGSSCTNDSLLMWTYVRTVGFLNDHDGTLWKISVLGWTNEAKNGPRKCLSCLSLLHLVATFVLWQLLIPWGPVRCQILPTFALPRI